LHERNKPCQRVLYGPVISNNSDGRQYTNSEGASI